MLMAKRKSRLYKKEILKRKDNFNRIFKNGSIESGLHVSIIFLETDQRKVGFVVSKKVKSGVQKNRCKRMLREIYRRNKSEFPENKYIILLAKGTTTDFSVLQNEVRKILSNI